MSVRAARTVATVFLLGMVAAVTWPGLTLFNRVEPYILGLPFSLAWLAGWVAAALPVLWLLDRAEARHRDGGER